jgi:hypothetical protein
MFEVPESNFHTILHFLLGVPLAVYSGAFGFISQTLNKCDDSGVVAFFIISK